MRRVLSMLVVLASLCLAASAPAAPKYKLKNGLWSIRWAGDNVGGGDFMVKQHKLVTFFEWGMNVPCADGTYFAANGKRGAEKKERADGTFGPILEGNPGGVVQLFFGGEFRSPSRAEGQFRWSFHKPQKSGFAGSVCDTGSLRWTARWSSGDSVSG